MYLPTYSQTSDPCLAMLSALSNEIQNNTALPHNDTEAPVLVVSAKPFLESWRAVVECLTK